MDGSKLIKPPKSSGNTAASDWQIPIRDNPVSKLGIRGADVRSERRLSTAVTYSSRLMLQHLPARPHERPRLLLPGRGRDRGYCPTPINSGRDWQLSCHVRALLVHTRHGVGGRSILALTEAPFCSLRARWT